MNITWQHFPKNTTLTFEYAFYQTGVGNLLIASWEKSLVYSAFASSKTSALAEAKKRFPKVIFVEKETATQKQLVSYIKNPNKSTKDFSVTTAGSPFQVRVWKTLLTVPFATTCFYSDLAKKLKQPTAVRAAASAVAANLLAILIPCHRVLPRSGGVGNYHWGTKNKSALLTWERLAYQK